MYNNNEKISVSSMAIGSIVGGALGATVGLLFAPKSGEYLREDINIRSKNVAVQANKWKNTVQEKRIILSNKAIAKKNELKAKKTFNASTTNFVIGSVAGGIFGASAGLIVAPKPGSDLRKDVNYRSKKALESAGELKDSIQGTSSNLVNSAKTNGTLLKNKSANATKKTLIKATEIKEVLQGNDPETLDRIVRKGTEVINGVATDAKYIINQIDKFSKKAENIAQLSIEATDHTKGLYDDVSKKSRSLKDDVVETSIEIKDEVSDYTKEIAHDAKDIKE